MKHFGKIVFLCSLFIVWEVTAQVRNNQDSSFRLRRDSLKLSKDLTDIRGIQRTDLKNPQKKFIPDDSTRFENKIGIQDSTKTLEKWKGKTSAKTPPINTNNKQKLRKKLKFSGALNNQYDYGAVPYYLANQKFPAQLFKSTGSLKVKYGRLPLIADYFYTNPRFMAGQNNYFTVKLDLEELQKDLNEEYLKKASVMKKELDSLNRQKASLKAQLMSAEMQKIKKQSIPDVSPVLPDSFPETGNPVPHNLADSVLNQLGGKKNTLKNPAAGLNPDSSLKQMSEIKEKMDAIDKRADVLKKSIELIEYPSPAKDPSKVLGAPGMPNALRNFKSLEVGMCYPAFSKFMINQMAIKGINTNYASKKLFAHLALGKTVFTNSIAPTFNPVLDQLQSMSNFFNFNTTSLNEKKIMAGKLGIGKENKNYLAIGALFGNGQASAFSRSINQNLVIELDGKATYKFINVEGALARSLLSHPDKPLVSKTIFTRKTDSYNFSYHARFWGTIPIAKTSFSQLVRLIEPNFKSYGLGFIRPDVLRFETKVEQPFGNRIKAGVIYRRDEDNLKGLQYSKTILENVTYNARFRFAKKKLEFSLSYATIKMQSKSIFSEQINKLNSYVGTAIVNYHNRFRKLRHTQNLVLNQYRMMEAEKNNTILNASYFMVNQYKKHTIRNSHAYNTSNITDSLLFSNAITSSLEWGYVLNERFDVNIGAKHAHSFKTKSNEFGYTLGFRLNLHKYCQIEMRAEKLVLGDYFNSLNYASIAAFPYYGYVKFTTVF